MEDTNHQDSEIDIDHNDSGNNDNDSNDEDTNTLGYTKHTILDKDTFHRLKQNDTSITDIEVALHTSNGECFFNSVDWKEDGDCIANNANLKSLRIIHHDERPDAQLYVLGEEGHNLPTREQLQGFFSCIYQNRSIKSLIISLIQIVDEFGGDLIEGPW